MDNELQRIIVPDVGQYVNPYIKSVNGNVVDELDLDGELERSVALEVIAGEWGSGEQRKERLEAAGYNYVEIQKIVNSIINGEPLNSGTANNTLVDEPVVETIEQSSGVVREPENVYVTSVNNNQETEEVNDYYKQICNIENDIEKFFGLGEKTTLFNETGARIVYEERKILADGTVEYYGEDGEVIKRINTNGTVEFFIRDSYEYYYNAEGQKVAGAWANREFGNNTNKIVILSTGVKEFYRGNKLDMIKGFDGSYKKYDNLFDDVIEIGYADGSYETYSAGILDKRFQSDGSYEKYNREGAVIRRGLADGSYTEYFDNGSVAAEANSNGDVISYDENGQVISKVFNSNDRENKVVEKYVDGNLNYRWDKVSRKYYDSAGNLVAVENISDNEYIIYNKDGTSNVYDDSKVSCGIGDDGYIIDIDYADGKSRHINANNDYVYNYNTGERVYDQGIGQTVGHYRISTSEDMANVFNSVGINCSIDKLPAHSNAYVNYNNGEVTSVQVINSGWTDRYSTGDRLTSFITNYEVLPNGSIEKTTIYFNLKDSIKSYQPNDLWDNPDQYIENVIDTVKETL